MSKQFDATKHPREADGTFANKGYSDPGQLGLDDEQPERYISASRAIEYRLDGDYHRLDGPALEMPNGDRFWYIHGELDRRDGPAVEWSNGVKRRYRHGVPHRLDGPAHEMPDGSGTYWIDGDIVEPDDPRLTRNSVRFGGAVLQAVEPHNPTAMAVRADRPLSDADMMRMAALVGYQHRAVARGRSELGEPRRIDDRTFAFDLAGVESSSSDPDRALSDMTKAVADTMNTGSPVRTSDRAGAGTAGTRLVGPVGDFEVEFLFANADDPEPVRPQVWDDFVAGGGFYDRNAMDQAMNELPAVGNDSPAQAWSDYKDAEKVASNLRSTPSEKSMARALASSSVKRIEHMFAVLGI